MKKISNDGVKLIYCWLFLKKWKTFLHSAGSDEISVFINAQQLYSAQTTYKDELFNIITYGFWPMNIVIKALIWQIFFQNMGCPSIINQTRAKKAFCIRKEPAAVV